MARVRKNISMEDSVLDKGQARAEKMFAGNFSIYLTYLINRDCEEIENAISISKTEVNVEKEKAIKLSEDVQGALEEIINL